MDADPRDGTAWLFCGRRCDRIKILLFNSNAYHLHYIRLEDGRYSWPRNRDEAWKLQKDEVIRLMKGEKIIRPEESRVIRLFG